MKKVLVTGAAGFIGFHTSRRLLSQGIEVVGFDNLNDYYDPTLKQARLDLLKKEKGFRFEKLDLVDRDGVLGLFQREKFTHVVHLAAQAGVRYSIQNPYAYTDANITGFIHMLEACRHNGTQHMVYASTSSVYGNHTNMPFSVHNSVDHPVSLYAATKKANELMAHSYSHLYKMPLTGLRFFTVYGPWGRPDMALFLFTKAILEGKPIDVFNNGKMKRDFTYVDDIVEGVVRILAKPPKENPTWDSMVADPATSSAPYRVYNIGNNKPVELLDFIEAIEEALGKKAQKNMMPLQKGDVPATEADVSDLMRDAGFRPDTPVRVGVKRFVDWYRDYYKV